MPLFTRVKNEPLHHMATGKAPTQASEDLKAARRLLANSSAILREVEESALVRDHKRSYPTFASSEVKVGPLLGMGGYCGVYEVVDFEWIEPDTNNGLIVSSGVSHDNHNHDDPVVVPVKREMVDLLVGGNHDEDEVEHPHYDVNAARHLMKDHVLRHGEARYAIKRLKKDFKDELERARGMLDLAIEAKFLAALWHPNIVKMRAVSNSEVIDANFFIVMDRLYDTLAVRVKSWRETRDKFKGGFLGRGANKVELRQLLVERMVVAYDLAAAFRYMHENGLVYRDMRKENIGFDVRGDVKVFDFGLSKCLSPALKATDERGREVYGYNLTPRTGSIPFMAPEVVEKLPYDTQCDVFSFAVLLWEILALKPAFGGPLTPFEFRQRVVMRSERPPVRSREWPAATCQILKEAWNETPQKRPTMDQVATVLRTDLNSMSDATEILNRTQHMKTLSLNSLKELNLNATLFQEVADFIGGAAEKSKKVDGEIHAKSGSVHSSVSGQ